MWEVYKAEAYRQILGDKDALVRGFRSRFKLNPDGVSLHLANLTPGMQNGHVHETLYELIMLVDGVVVAIRWDGGCIDTFALVDQGDAVLFRPGQPHTLMVERDSLVVVVRFAATDADPDERVPLDLPAALASVRNRFLGDPRSVSEAALWGGKEWGEA